MNIWAWLNVNSGALQSILALVTICVLLVTWWAIKIQAEAARALTKVASEQTQAAKDAAEATKRQADLLAGELELSTAPLIVVEPDDRPMGSGQRIVNRGPGPAFQVHYWRGGLELTRPGTAKGIYPIDPSTLAPGRHVYEKIPEDWDTWTIQCKGIDGQERWTIVYVDSSRGQEHVIRRGTEQIHLW